MIYTLVYKYSQNVMQMTLKLCTGIIQPSINIYKKVYQRGDNSILKILYEKLTIPSNKNNVAFFLISVGLDICELMLFCFC